MERMNWLGLLESAIIEELIVKDHDLKATVVLQQDS